MNSFYEGTYTVNTREIDGQNRCRLSALLGYLQEAATTHACLLHVSRKETLEKYNSFWMLARIWCRLERPLLWNETFTVRTSYREGKGASFYRDFDLFVDGMPVGEAVSVWVLADLDTRRLLRMSRVQEFSQAEGSLSPKTKTLSRIHLPEGMVKVDCRKLYYSDTDINCHVNNTRYADFTCDALRLETLDSGLFVSELQLDYTAECRPGEELTILSGELDGRMYVQGLDPEGKSRFDALLGYGTAPQ